MRQSWVSRNRCGDRRDGWGDAQAPVGARRPRGGPQKTQGWPWPPMTAPAQADPLPPPWAPSADDLDGLGAAGQRFLTAILGEFDVDVIHGLLLVECARTLDSLTAWRAQAHTDRKAAALTLQHSRQFAALLGQLALR